MKVIINYDDELKNLVRDVFLMQVKITEKLQEIVNLRELVINQKVDERFEQMSKTGYESYAKSQQKKVIDFKEEISRIGYDEYLKSQQVRVNYGKGKCLDCSILITGNFSSNASVKFPDYCKVCEERYEIPNEKDSQNSAY